MQDIDGCRITVKNLQEQDDAVASIMAEFPDADLQDFRETSHFGYRAVHIIVPGAHPFEIQIRTEVQNRWAQLSEGLSGPFGSDLKYGGGSPTLREAMEALSQALLAWDKLNTEAGRPRDGGCERGDSDVQARFTVIDRQIAAALADIDKEVNSLVGQGARESPAGE